MKEHFIGRKNELQQILAVVQDGSPQALISLQGPGGVGKTSLAGQVITQVRQIYPTIRCVTIDFDLQPERSILYIKNEIAAASDGNLLEAYRDAERFVVNLEKEHVPLDLLKQARENALKTYTNIVYRSDRPRLFLVFDTLERVQTLDLFQDLLSILRDLENVIVLFCGRRNAEVENELQAVFGVANFTQVSLQPFSLPETKEYFRKLLTGSKKLEKDDYEKLWILTQGRPIYLDLAAAWILETIGIDNRPKKNGSWPGKSLLSLDLEQIKQNHEQLHKEFSFEILNGVRQLSSPLDWAILYMALLERPFTADLWQYLLDIDAGAAERLTATLQELFFVRANDRLHDEMRDLLLEKVWPYVDPDHKTQQDALDRIIAYVVEHKTTDYGIELAQQEAEELCLRLNRDLEAGYIHFLTRFDQALDAGWIKVCRMLIDEMMTPGRLDRLATEQKSSVLLRLDKLQNYEGRPSKATLTRDYATVEEKVLAYCTAAYGVRDEDPERAAALYEKALAIVRDQPERDEVLEARVLNWLGMVYRRLGRFDDAIATFRKCIDLRKKHGLLLDAASTRNNLAYIYRQQGNLDLALILARESYVVRQTHQDQNGMAYSLRTIAELYRDQNDIIGAQARFTEARQIFRNLGNDCEAALVDVELANLARKMHDPVAADSYFHEAYKIFEHLNDREGMAYLKNERGCELRKRGKESSRSDDKCSAAPGLFSQAEEYFQESIKICREMHNWYRLADNFADLALLYCYQLEHEYRQQKTPDQSRLDALVRLVKQTSFSALVVSRRYRFDLIESRAIEVLGELCFIQADYQQQQGNTLRAKKLYYQAFAMYYLPACSILANYFSAHLWRYHLIFERLNRKILSPAVPDEMKKTCAAYLARRWREEGNERIAPGFIEVYQTLALGEI